MTNRAWVTLATNDSYGLGALVLAHSLRRVGSAYPAVVLITPSVTDAMRERLSAVFEVVTVDVLDSQDAAHLALLKRPELGITFTKIHCWNLTQYEKCVFLDADILVVQNCDELFEREELSAAPDVGWPDCFNSGVFVFTPSADTFSRLIKFAQERGSFDGGDQGLLNSFFSDWSSDNNKRLPFLYNVTSAAFYSYLPALKHFGQNLKIIHFIGPAKPWLQHYNFESQSVDAPEHLKGFLQVWWNLFTSQVHNQLDEAMTGVAGNLARVQPGVPLQREALDELSRRQGWESGNIDYMGADSFANIWAKISQTLSGGTTKQSSPPKDSPSVVEAQEPVRDLAEKVASVSLDESNDIPVPAREAATAAGNTGEPISESIPNIQVNIPESSPESVLSLECKTSKVSETDEKTETSVPKVTVPDVEQSVDISSTEIPLENVPVVVPQTEISDTSNIPSEPLVSLEPHDTLVEPSSQVHAIDTKNDIPKIDVQQSTEVHVPETAPAVETAPVAEAAPVAETALVAETVSIALAESPDSPKHETELHESKVVPDNLNDKKDESNAATDVTDIETESHESLPEPELSVEPASEPALGPASKPALGPASEPALGPASLPLPTETEKSESKPEITEPLVEQVMAAPKADESELVESSEILSDIPALDPKPVTPVQEKPDTDSVPEIPQQEKSSEITEKSVSDSPPLANTPSTEEVPSVPAAKLEERRRPAAKLQLKPPSAADPLPTPDSEFEDAASLAQSIIASELRTPTVTSASPPADPVSPQPQAQQERLDVKKPDVPTPPVGAVSLSQIGVKPKTKPTTAAQIESSVSENIKSEPPKKKVVKKVVKKDSASSGEAPVPPPRKKEKKPKEK
ncbi:titin isoform X4 [Pieris brassicae]|uniref:titin isoform X4 n=1 Tax=Pieris brassicae TaxID=7116 RepID=UPI001E65F5AE|nr:titin isoform X4 [Pieris brassicae]